MERQKRSAIGILAALLMSISVNTAFAADTLNTFTDVSTSHPNYTAIMGLKTRGVISGYADGTFKPDQPVNRVEALKMILLGAGITSSADHTTASFKDTSTSEWYAQYLNKAVELNVVGGYPDGTFKPTQTVNLAENLKMLLLAQTVDLSNINPTVDPYADTPKAEWYAKYVQYAKDKKLIDADSSNKVYPSQAMTRGKLAETMFRVIYMKENNQTEFTPPDNSTPPDTNPALVLDINIENSKFGSPDITIGQGTTLKWTNKDSVDHTVTSDTGIVLDSPLMSKGDSFSHTFNDLGTYEYHCSVHPGMKGKVTVKPKDQVPTI